MSNFKGHKFDSGKCDLCGMSEMAFVGFYEECSERAHTQEPDEVHSYGVWIPVSDLAPKEHDVVLIYGKFYCHKGIAGWSERVDKSHPVAYGWEIKTAYLSHGTWQANTFSGVDVTHWMPLPETPQGSLKP